MCAAKKSLPPPDRALSRSDILKLITRLRKEYGEKDACLNRMIRFYEQQVK